MLPPKELMSYKKLESKNSVLNKNHANKTEELRQLKIEACTDCQDKTYFKVYITQIDKEFMVRQKDRN